MGVSIPILYACGCYLDYSVMELCSLEDDCNNMFVIQTPKDNRSQKNGFSELSVNQIIFRRPCQSALNDN